MGQSSPAIARRGARKETGTLELETDFLLFRGESRTKIPFSEILAASAVAGELRVRTRDGRFAFQLGPKAEDWLNRIRNPKSVLEKMGIGPGTVLELRGDFAPEFRSDIDARGARTSPGSSIVLARAESPEELDRRMLHAERLADDGAFWIVYPKGRKDITERLVLSAGRAAGFKDVKVVRFSETHTALKFVRPVASRATNRAPATPRFSRPPPDASRRRSRPPPP